MPKYEYKSLKDIDKKVSHVMEKLKLEASNSVEDAIKGRQNFYLAVTDYRGKKIFFKARIADHRVLKQWNKNFKNERRFLQTIKKTGFESTIVKRLPTYVKSQLTDCEWLMTEFIEGSNIGVSCMYYDNPTKHSMDEVIRLLLDIQDFPIFEFAEKHPWAQKLLRCDHEWYHNSFHRLIHRKGRTIRQVLPQSMLDQADEIIRASEGLLNDNCNLFVHGDFHPANVIMSGNQAIAVDWEEIHYDNASCDITDLWYKMTDKLPERKYLLKKFANQTLQKEDFAELFRLNLLVRLPEEIYWLRRLILIDYPDKEEIAKLLEVCYSNYESAIKGVKLDQYD